MVTCIVKRPGILDNMAEGESDKGKLNQVEDQVAIFYKEAFDCFDWNHSGRISTNVSFNSTPSHGTETKSLGAIHI